MKMNSEERLIFWFIVGIVLVVMLFLLFDSWWGSKKTPEIPALNLIISTIQYIRI